MKIHRSNANAVADIIVKVLDQKQVLDRVIQTAFSKNPKWGKRDRSFIAETAYEVCRWKRALEFVADHDSISAICAAQWLRMGFQVPDWWQHPGCSPDMMCERESQLTEQPRAIRESIPDWLDAHGEEELGPQWEIEIRALNRRAPVYLRANRLLNTRDEAREWLLSLGVQTDPVAGVPDALVLPPGSLLPKSVLASGRVEIQDAGSQLVAPLLDALPGERIIDSCAGAGGKTLQLAAMMKNFGRIDALDVSPDKLKELRRRASRAGADIIDAALWGTSKLTNLQNSADRLLVDAPCSGLGTLRRQPDIKWRLTMQKLDQLHQTQRQILQEQQAMVKPGGRLVYATCSILPSENRRSIDPLLDTGHFQLLSEHQISPAETGFDGFYAAVLLKNQV